MWKSGSRESRLVFSLSRIDGSVCHSSGSPSITSPLHQARLISEAIFINVYRRYLAMITMPSSLCLCQFCRRSQTPSGRIARVAETQGTYPTNCQGPRNKPSLRSLPLCGLRPGACRLFGSRQATSDDSLEIKTRRQCFSSLQWAKELVCVPMSILFARLCAIYFLAKHVSSYYQRQKDSRSGTNSS